MTSSYAGAGLLFLGLFLLGGVYSLFKNGVKVMALLLLVCAVMAIASGAMRW